MANPKFKQDDMMTKDSVNENMNAVTDSFDDVVKKTPKSVKWLAGTAVGLVILAGGAGIIATQVIDQQKYKGLIVSKVEEATGYTIDWSGNINLGLMPLPHASVSDLSVKSGSNQILSIAKADVQVALMPLLSKKVQIKNVSLDSPVVTLTTAKNGRKTWMTEKLSANKKSDESASQSTASSADDAPMDIRVDKIEITNGKFIIDNQQTGSKQELDNLDLALRADSLNGPFDIDGSTEWSGQTIKLKATSGAVNGDDGVYPIQASISLPSSGISTNFSGTVNSKSPAVEGDITVDVDNITKAAKGFTGSAPSLPKGLDGKAMLAGKLVYSSRRVALDDMALSLGALSYAGKMEAFGLSDNEQPQLAFSLTPKSKVGNDADPIVQLLSDLSVAAKGSVEDNKIQIVSANLKTQGNNISISGHSSMGANPTVDLAINGSELNLDSLQQKMNGAGEAVSSSSGGSSSSSAKSGDMGFTVPFSGRVRANIGKLTTGGKTYSSIVADVVSGGGALTISNASVSLPENALVSVSGKIGDTQKLSALDLKVKARAADAEKLMVAYGVTPPNVSQKIGAASIDGKFTGDLDKLGFDTTVSALKFDVTGVGTVADPMGTPVINSLKFTVRHPNFNDAMKTFQPGFDGSNGFYGALDLSGQVAWSADKYDLTALNGKLGQTAIAGNISAATKPKMSITGDLDLGNIVLPSATTGSGGGAAAASSGSAAPAASGGRWSSETIDSAWMRAFDADIKIKAKSITQNMWKLTDANFAFNLKDGTLTIDDVSAGLFGGHASINGTVKSGAGAKDPLTISTKMKADNVDAQGLMSAATGKVSHTLTGTLSDVNVAVNATGASPSALIQTLGGNGTMNGKNIIVQGVDAAQLAATAKGSYKPLERAGSLFQTFQGGSTEFTDFNSEFVIQNGVVNFSKIFFDGPKATLNSVGNVNLPRWTVDLKNTMTVKDTDIPPFDFAIRGPLDNPINSGGDVINNYLQNKLQKKATKLLEDKLGKFLGGGQSETAPVEAAPVDGAAAPADGLEAAPAPAPQPTAKQKAAQDAVNALQGLFGQ